MAYRRIFASPHVLQLTIASVVARLPVGMTGVALVIYVHDRTGSFGAAGVVAGASTIGASAGSAIAGPIVQAGGWRAGVLLAAGLPALGLPFLLARRGLLPAQSPVVVEADPRPHQAVVDEAGLG